MRLLPNIRFGTEQYPPKVARRLRALNITTWSAAVLGSIFAVMQLLDPTPGAWKVALTNVFGSLALAMIPMLHRIGPRAAPAGFAIIIYAYIFVVCWQIGVGTGMQIQYLAVAAVTILFLGTERIFLISAFAVAAVVLIIILEIFVPRNTGLLPATTVFYNFIFGVSATCAILFTVVFYAVREAARAEAVAEHEHARSEGLLANILPATIAAGSRAEQNRSSLTDTTMPRSCSPTWRASPCGQAILLPTNWFSSLTACSRISPVGRKPRP